MKKLPILIQLIALAWQTTLTIGDETKVSLPCEKWSKSHLHYAPLYLNFESLLSNRKYYIAYVQFLTLADLNISCGHLKESITRMLVLKSTDNKFQLDLTFDIRPLLASFIFDIEIYIETHELKGFNLYTNKNSTPVEHNITAHIFTDSYFDFYLNKTQLITKESCVKINFEHTIFNFGLHLLFTSVYYSKHVCPYVFLKSPFKTITFNHITNSFVYKNQLEFLTINEAENFELPNIYSVTVIVAYEHISSKLISRNIFKDVVSIHLLGFYYGIQADLFAGFKRLKDIQLQPDSFAVLFSQEFKWITSLNWDVNQTIAEFSLTDESSIDLSRAIYLVFSDVKDIDYTMDTFKRAYVYPDEDLCLFKDFPHNQLVAPIILPAKPIACTCTVVWLVQYAAIYKQIDSETYESLLGEMNDTVCSREMKCNFTERLAKCLQNQTRHIELGFFEGINFDFHVKLLQYTVEVHLQPILCLISLLTNILIIFTLRNKTPEIKKHLVNIMYSHIQVNAIFNIIYAVIKLVSLVNLCIFPRSSFCSEIYKRAASQYFKIYVVFFLANSVRLCSNFSYVCFSVSRYFLSTSKPSRVFSAFQKVNLNTFYCIIFCLSMGLNLFRVFQFRANLYFTGVDKDYPFDGYSIDFCHEQTGVSLKKSYDVQFKSLRIKCQMFTALNMINTLVDNILFFVINIVIDVGLIQFTNQNLERKRRLFTGGETRDLSQAITLKKNVTKMIIVNGLLYFVSHVPEFIFTVFMLFLSTELASTCGGKVSCIELNDIAKTLNFFSMGFQIFVFKHFDRNFCNSLDNLLDRFLYKYKKKN